MFSRTDLAGQDAGTGLLGRQHSSRVGPPRGVTGASLSPKGGLGQNMGAVLREISDADIKVEAQLQIRSRKTESGRRPAQIGV